MSQARGSGELAAARAAGLRYVWDGMPGIRRRRVGRGFAYSAPDGSAIGEPEEIARIRALAVPPAWRDVWICPSPSGHIQATGRDARGRKQYRYHPRWRAHRDETKYDRLRAFGEALPRLRRRVTEDLADPELSRKRVVAALVRLLDRTLVRIGNDSYARENASFGLTTLRERHVRVRGSRIRFQFRGKAGKLHEVDLDDARVARVVRRCQDLPGQKLFRYADATGHGRTIGSEHVNEYLREAAGDDFTAKDFRTWAGTVLFARALDGIGPARTPGAATRAAARAIEAVAAMLRNTPAVCRKAYIHPAFLELYLNGEFSELWARATRSRRARLRRDEAAVLWILRALERRARSPAAA